MYPSPSTIDLPLQELGGGGGNSTLGGSYKLTPVFKTGDFSNSSTPPYKNLERRGGFEPGTPGLPLGRSPLAVAPHGTPGVIRTPNRGFGIRSPHHRHPVRGAPGWIRTSTVPLLRRLPLAVGATGAW